MSLFSELDAKDKNGLFQSNDNVVCYPTGFTVLDYANGYWSEVMDENGNMVHVPNLGIPGGSLVSIIGSTGVGKAIPVETELPTPAGMKKASEIKAGDYLFDRLGQPTRVLGVYPQGKKKNFRITFQDGRVAHSCDEHLWTVISGYGQDTTLITLPLKEIIRRYKTPQCVSADGKLSYSYNYGVPTAGPVEFDFSDHRRPVEPLLLGALFGVAATVNPQKPNQYSFSTAHKASDICKDLLNLYNLIYNSVEVSEVETDIVVTCKKCLNLTEDKLSDDEFTEFIDTGLGSKIPDAYKYGPIEVRKEFLKGFLTVRGYLKNPGEVKLIFNSEENLADDIVWIARSLGLYVENRLNVPFFVTISIPTNEFVDYFYTANDSKRWPTLTIIDEEIKELAKQKKMIMFGRLMIVNIEEVEPTEMVCFYVDNHEHLFLTENFVVTHNTTLATQIGWNIVKNFDDGMLFIVDCEKSSGRERLTNILGCDRDEPRLRILKSKSSIDDVLESFDLLCKTKEDGGRKYMYEVKHHTYNGESFWVYVPTVYIIDSLPKFNCRDFNDKDLGGNIDAMRGAKDVTRFYTNIVDRAWQYNVIFIVINHIRPNLMVNPYAQPPRGLMMINPQAETLPRGSVAQYYSSVYFRVNSKKSGAYTMEDDGFTGFRCEIQLAKSRTNVIGSILPVTFNSDRGYDPIYSMYEFAHANGLVQGRNPYLSIKGFEERKFNRKEFVSLMTADESFRNGVLTALRPYYESLLSSRRERVAAIKDMPDLSIDTTPEMEMEELAQAAAIGDKEE